MKIVLNFSTQMLKTLSAFKIPVTPKPKFLGLEVNVKNVKSISILMKLVEIAHKTHVQATKFWEQTENVLIVPNSSIQMKLARLASKTPVPQKLNTLQKLESV